MGGSVSDRVGASRAKGRAMSPRVFLFLALAGLAPAAALAGTAVAPPAPALLTVTIDQAKVAQLPVGTRTLVVGNPAIADVTMLKGGGAMVVTGKGYGLTNLIALDAQGNIIDEKSIAVEPAKSVLVVQRGDERESYWCNPLCMPTVQVGDDDKAFSAASGQITAHSTLAQGASTKPAN
jgi:Pilus formation protein N terminal region